MIKIKINIILVVGLSCAMIFYAHQAHALVSVATGSVTRLNMRMSILSVGSGLSTTGLPNAPAFVDFCRGADSSSVCDGTNLKNYIGYKLVITDTAGKTLTGYIKAAGTGETYSDYIGGTNPSLRNGDFSAGDTVWSKGSGATITGSGATGKGVLSGVSGGSSIYQAPPGQTTNALFKLTGDFVITSGSAAFRIEAVNQQIRTTSGTYTDYYVDGSTANFGVTGVTAWTGTIDNISFQRVLTPSSTGVSIVSTYQGGTYNWSSMSSGFNMNDTNGYTYAIYPGTVATTISGNNVASSNNIVDCQNNPAALGVNITGTGFVGRNITVVRCPAGAFQFEQSATLTNSIATGTSGITIATGKTVTGANNIFSDSGSVGSGTYSDSGGTTWSGSPIFEDITDGALIPSSSSNLIDVGTTTAGISSDYLGNPIYGLPDIGAYEYQPPYTEGTTQIPTTGSVRIYSNGKYRTLTATSTESIIATSNFSVVPSGGSYYTASTSQYLDITINNWSTTGAKNKQWTATSTDGGVGYTHATSTIYTIGDLLPSTAYTFKLDGLASTTAITGYGSTVCTNGVCTSNSSGVVSFTYTGGYSTHTFALVDITAPVLTETTAISTPSTDTTPSYVFSSSEAGTLLYAGACTPSSSTSISIGSNTVTFNTLSDGTYTNCKISVIDTAGNDSATTTLASFTIETVAPVSAASPSGATYSSLQSVSLTCSDTGSGCDKIYYTTNGSTPTTGSSIYSTPITMPSGYTSLKFFATDLAGNSEAVKTENYTIITGSVPVASAPAGSAPTQTQTVPAGDVKSPLPPLLKGENTNPPSPLYQGGKIVTMEQMLSEAKLILQPANGVTQTAPTALANFISNGTPTTLILGSGERSGVVNSFTSAFGRAPQSETDWSDVIKIANGRWPSQTNQTTETNAAAAFRKIYNRAPNLQQANDKTAVTVISYGLRPSQRNLNSEKAAIKSFKSIYGHTPKSAMAWDIVRAIAYSGAKR